LNLILIQNPIDSSPKSSGTLRHVVAVELAILGVDVHVWLGIVPDACLHFCASNVLLRPDLGRGNEKHGLRELSSGFMRIVYAAILGDIAQGFLVVSLEYLLQSSTFISVF
jgi:hypothetical protein